MKSSTRDEVEGKFHQIFLLSIFLGLLSYEQKGRIENNLVVKGS